MSLLREMPKSNAVLTAMQMMAALLCLCLSHPSSGTSEEKTAPTPDEARKAQLKSVESAQDYLRLASFPSKKPSTIERQEMDRFVRESLHVFFRTSPSIDDVLTLLSQAVTDQRLGVEIRKTALAATRGVEPYLELASPLFIRPDSAQRAALDRFLAETVDEFIERKPSVEDLKEIERRSISSLEVRLIWMRAGLRVVNSLDTFLRLTEFTGPKGTLRHPPEDYREAMEAFVRESLAELVNKGAVQMGELKLLEAERAEAPETHRAFLSAGLPLVRSAEDFVQLARFTDEDPSDVYRQVRDDFLRENRNRFFALHPSPGQVSRLLLNVRDEKLAGELEGQAERAVAAH